MDSEIDTAQQRAHFIDIMYNFAIHGIDEGEEAKVRSEIGAYFDRFSKQTRRDALAEAVREIEKQFKNGPTKDLLSAGEQLGIRAAWHAVKALDRLREGVKG